MGKTKRKNMKRGGNKLKKSKNSKKKIMRRGDPPYHEDQVVEQGRGQIHPVSLINADGHPGVYVYDIYNPSKPIKNRHGRKDSFPPMSIYKIPIDVYNSITHIDNPHRRAFKPIIGDLLDEYRSGYWTIIFAQSGEQGHPSISYYAVNSRHILEDGGVAADKYRLERAESEREKEIEKTITKVHVNLQRLYDEMSLFGQNNLRMWKGLATPDIVARYLLDLYFPLSDMIKIYEDILKDLDELSTWTDGSGMEHLISNPKYILTLRYLQIHPNIISKYPQLRLS